MVLIRKLRSVPAYLYQEYRKRQLDRPIYDLTHYYFNREPKKLYRRQKRRMALCRLQQQVADELRQKGISTIHIADLIPGRKLGEYQELAESLVQRPANLIKIEGIERSLEKSSKPKEQFTAADKSYVVHLLGDKPVFDFNDKFTELALSPEILNIVCDYMGMLSRLVMMDLWYNIPTHGPQIYSQRWHRDPDDKREVKLFFYLRDVDEFSGPLHYVPQSHNQGRLAHVYAQTIPVSQYPPEGAVENELSNTSKMVCTGTAGTLVFCDTTGLHRGGDPTRGARLLFTAVYTTNASVQVITGKKLFSIRELKTDFPLSAAAYAISHLQD